MSRLWSTFALVMLAPVYLALAPKAVFAQGRAPAREQEILQIQKLIENHDLAGAAALLVDAKKEFPLDEGFDNLRGIVEAQQGDYAAAEKSFTAAIQHSPRFTGAYLNLGRLYQETAASNPQAAHQALDVYERVLRYESGNVEANYQAAVLLLREGRYQDSLSHASRLPADVQGAAQTLAVLCADYAELGDRKNADLAAARLIARDDFSEVDAQQVVPVLAAS